MPDDKSDSIRPENFARNDSVNGISRMRPGELRKKLDEVEKIARSILGNTQARMGSAQPTVQSHAAALQIGTIKK
jgi:hypothetical protein